MDNVVVFQVQQKKSYNIHDMINSVMTFMQWIDRNPIFYEKDNGNILI
ncbi:MAG: hypothetical protein LBS19_06325 [Clostridiales bacterium]|nr:hypothetical protein [Clostridiales bacterium]